MSKICNIAVVDDDKSIRTVLTTALIRAGFNVISSGTTAGLWRLIENEKIDILVDKINKVIELITKKNIKII